MNQWLGIWITPRATIREIIDTNPTHRLVPLAIVLGIVTMFDSQMNLYDTGEVDLATALILTVIIGPIMGFVIIYVGGWFLKWLCSLFGGQATSDEVRAVLAWSSVLEITMTVLFWIPMIIFSIQNIFSGQTSISDVESNPSLVDSIAYIYTLIFFGAGLIVGIWYLVVYLICLSEVNRFSVWKALLATLLPLLVIMIPIFLIFGLLFAL